MGRYAEGGSRILRDLGGRGIWSGAAKVLVIGDEPLPRGSPASDEGAHETSERAKRDRA